MDEVLRKKIKELEHVPPRKADCLHHPYDKDGLHYDPFFSNPICTDCFADQIFALIREARFVKLAEDQSLPANPLDCSNSIYYEGDRYHARAEAQQDMLKANFRKVELGA